MLPQYPSIFQRDRDILVARDDPGSEVSGRPGRGRFPMIPGPSCLLAFYRADRIHLRLENFAIGQRAGKQLHRNGLCIDATQENLQIDNVMVARIPHGRLSECQMRPMLIGLLFPLHDLLA